MPTPASRATASRLALASPRLNTDFAASSTRSRLRSASARGLRGPELARASSSACVCAGACKTEAASAYAVRPDRRAGLSVHLLCPERSMSLSINLTVNGTQREVELEAARVTLLDLLRERLHLTGTKKGCDRGQCGACTVLLDGRRVNACLMIAASADGADVL